MIHKFWLNAAICKTKGWVKYSYVDAVWINVSDIGKLHVTFPRKKSKRKIIGLVTDDPKLSASKMNRTYSCRWSTKIFLRTTSSYWS